MKRVIVSFIAGAVLATAGIAGAVTTGTIRLGPGDHVRWAGADCKATALPYSKWLTCVSSWKYSVIYSPRELSVFRGQKIVFNRQR